MIKERFALLAERFQHGQNRMDVTIRQTPDCPHAKSLSEEFDDLDGLGIVYSQRVKRVGF